MQFCCLPPHSVVRANASNILPSTFDAIWHLVHIMELHILPLISAATLYIFETQKIRKVNNTGIWVYMLCLQNCQV
jgi:hypothetical protein